jgi:hypothetical protein
VRISSRCLDVRSPDGEAPPNGSGGVAMGRLVGREFESVASACTMRARKSSAFDLKELCGPGCFESRDRGRSDRFSPFGASAEPSVRQSRRRARDSAGSASPSGRSRTSRFHRARAPWRWIGRSSDNASFGRRLSWTLAFSPKTGDGRIRIGGRGPSGGSEGFQLTTRRPLGPPRTRQAGWFGDGWLFSERPGERQCGADRAPILSAGR